MKKNLKLTMLSIALLLISAILFGSIYAYFTDGDTTTNTFTVGRISLKLEEPNWTPPENITPNQEIEKDPQITNDGVNEEFVFLEVRVPYKAITVAEDDGTPEYKKSRSWAPPERELFTYITNPDWTEIARFKDYDNRSRGHFEGPKEMVHLYVYGSTSECTPLAKGETTPPLFNSVKFCNAIEDQGLELSELQIVINAYGIQTNNINGGKTTPTDVWEVINNQREIGIEDTKKFVTLMNGSNFNALFKENFPIGVTSVEFIKESDFPYYQIDDDAIDFSEQQDGSILGEKVYDTVYIISKNTDTILANQNSSGMFAECDELSNIELNNFDTSNVTDMGSMFAGCTTLTDLNISLLWRLCLVGVLH